MSSSPWTVVNENKRGASAAPKVGYMNGSGGAYRAAYFQGPAPNVVCLY